VAYQDTASELKGGATELCHKELNISSILTTLKLEEIETLNNNLKLSEGELSQPLIEALKQSNFKAEVFK
jgi:hypothetical protein